MTERISVFDTLKVDVSDFAPKAASTDQPHTSEIDRVSSPKFRSREASAATNTPRQSSVRQPMVYRTGRNVTFSVKTTQTTLDLFYDIAQSNGWKAADTFEHALKALADLQNQK